MKNQDFRIGNTTVWVLVIGNILLSLIGALAKIQDWAFFEVFLSVGLLLFFSTWVIIISDMVKNKIYNKTFWVISMFIIPTIASLFYLIQRNKLLRLGQRLP